MLKENKIDELIQYMDDFKISNEMIKEHLIGLSINSKKLSEQFENIDSQYKA